MGKKREKEDNNKFEGFYEHIQKLERKNDKLSEDNALMAKKLNSKRYRAVDFCVDSAYALVRGKSLKRRLIDDNIDAEKNRIRIKMPERKIVKGRIDIINVNFFSWDGKTVYKGGAERYVYDLACLLKEMKYSPRILQCSDTYFEKKFKGIDVVGIGVGDKNNMYENSFLFNKFCRDAEMIIASPLELACKIEGVPIIGINHGINFDGDWNHYNESNLPDYNIYMRALRNVYKCVCVDTNFINWTRTLDYKNAMKEAYIPNYYDEKQFDSIKKRHNDKITFVYPRRIYNARGADLTIEVFDKVLAKYGDKVRLNFVGQVDNKEIGEKLDALMEKYKDNVFRCEYDMDEMYKAYEDADVVLVPTRYCEGTSLSCIEAMAVGITIVTTNVGGLPNLVIDGYNGRLISPNAEELESVVVELINDSSERKRLAKNGQMVAKSAFTKEMWEKKWKAEIKGALSL